MMVLTTQFIRLHFFIYNYGCPDQRSVDTRILTNPKETLELVTIGEHTQDQIS